MTAYSLIMIMGASRKRQEGALASGNGKVKLVCQFENIVCGCPLPRRRRRGFAL